MAKDKSEKKVKKEKRSEVDGVKKSKKEKKDKKPKSKDKLEAALLNQLEADEPVKASEDDESPAPVAAANGVSKAAEVDDEMEVELKVIPKEALVPFAFPLADEKQTKKLLKGVKKASKAKCIKRGVKEVVKCVRKSESNGPSSSGATDPISIVILAADISPMDVISHIPVLCEDHNIPYIFVTSRAELGAAGNTKRPTSVVLLTKDRGAKVKGGESELVEYKEAYTDLQKLVLKAGATVKI